MFWSKFQSIIISVFIYKCKNKQHICLKNLFALENVPNYIIQHKNQICAPNNNSAPFSTLFQAQSNHVSNIVKQALLPFICLKHIHKNLFKYYLNHFTCTFYMYTHIYINISIYIHMINIYFYYFFLIVLRNKKKGTHKATYTLKACVFKFMFVSGNLWFQKHVSLCNNMRRNKKYSQNMAYIFQIFNFHFKINISMNWLLEIHKWILVKCTYFKNCCLINSIEW